VVELTPDRAAAQVGHDQSTGRSWVIQAGGIAGTAQVAMIRS